MTFFYCYVVRIEGDKHFLTILFLCLLKLIVVGYDRGKNDEKCHNNVPHEKIPNDSNFSYVVFTPIPSLSFG